MNPSRRSKISAAASPSSKARFSVETLPERERYEAWRESIGCIFDVTMTRTQRQDGLFHATLEARMVDTLMLVRTRTAGQHWERPAWKIARDGLDHYMIQLYALGSQACDWRGGSVTMPKDGLLVYDLTREMKARSSAFDNLSLIIPRAQLAPLLNGPDGQHMRALRGDAPLVDLLRSHIQHLEASADRLGPTQTRHLAQASLHLVAACLNSAADPAEASAPSDAPSQLLAACRYIEARLWNRDLDAGALCRLLGVSRTRLYEIFAPLGGVAGHIRERRLRAALSMLVDPALREVPIAAIAERCLFTPAEIGRAFRRHFGLSPRAARHHAMAPRFVLDAQGLDRSYEHWLQHLVASPRYPEHATN